MNWFWNGKNSPEQSEKCARAWIDQGMKMWVTVVQMWGSRIATLVSSTWQAAHWTSVLHDIMMLIGYSSSVSSFAIFATDCRVNGCKGQTRHLATHHRARLMWWEWCRHHHIGKSMSATSFGVYATLATQAGHKMTFWYFTVFESEKEECIEN